MAIKKVPNKQLEFLTMVQGLVDEAEAKPSVAATLSGIHQMKAAAGQLMWDLAIIEGAVMRQGRVDSVEQIQELHEAFERSEQNLRTASGAMARWRGEFERQLSEFLDPRKPGA